MAKNAFVGINNLARMVKQPYIGIGGVARKVITAYVGVNGIARQWWPNVYTLTVIDGSGSGDYPAGTSVTIIANAPPSGKTFDKWIMTGITLSGLTSSTKTFDMPSNDVTATATYKTPAATRYELIVYNDRGGLDFVSAAFNNISSYIFITLDPASSDSKYDSGTDVTIKVELYYPFSFKEWDGADAGSLTDINVAADNSKAEAIITMDSNKTIIANLNVDLCEHQWYIYSPGVSRCSICGIDWLAGGVTCPVCNIGQLIVDYLSSGRYAQCNNCGVLIVIIPHH
jgi:hypothetical protein